MKRLLLCLFALCAACHKQESGAPAASTAANRSFAPPPAEPQLSLPKAAREEDEFKVVAGRPQGKLVGGVHPTITFSEPIVALGMLDTGKDPAQALRLDPPVKGRWHWLGSASVEFINDEPFPYSTAFHLVVPDGFASLDGAKLERSYQLDFTTPAVEVDPYSTEPYQGSCRWSRPDQLFKLTVNQPVAEPEKMFFFEVGEEKRRVPATIVRTVSVLEELRQRDARARSDGTLLGFKDQRTRYEIAPSKPIPLATGFAVGLEPEAHGTQGSLIAGKEYRMACRTPGPMKIVGVQRCVDETAHCPTGPIALELSNPLASLSDLKSRLHLTPDPKLQWEDDETSQRIGYGTRVAVSGRFRAGEIYKVHVDAGLKDELGQAAPAFDGELRMDDLLPSLYVGSEKALLESGGDGQLPAQVTNLEELDADLWQVSPQQMAQHELCESQKCSRLPQGPPDAPLRMQLSYPDNEPHLHGVDLRAALHGAKTGLVAVRLTAPGTEFAQHPLRVLAQITDVAVHAKLGASASLAWVTSVSRAQPLPGAVVRVFDAAGLQIAEAKADGQGVAVLPGYDKLAPGRFSDEPPRLLVAATAEGDTGYVTTEGYDELVPPEVGRDFDAGRRRGVSLIFADRGIYRPGDLTHVKGLVRTQTGGVLATPSEGSQLHVAVKDPEGKAILERDVRLSRFGTFSIDAAVPSDGRLGTYEVQVSGDQPRGASEEQKLVYGQGSFRVAEYRAPQFRVDVMVPKPELLAGEELSATVIGRYLFGGAMDRAETSWSVQRTTEEFTPPRNDSFRFGRQTWSWDDGAPARDSGVFASGKGEIDRSGTLAVRAGKVEAMADRPARYTLEAEVADVSRQRVAGRGSVLVHPASIYVGLGKTELFAKVGAETRVPLVAVKPDGTRVAVPVHLAVLLRSWHSVRKRGMNGIYQTLSEPVEEKVAECDVRTSDAGAQDCKLVLPKPGFFTLRAEAKDEAGRLALTTAYLYGIGAGEAAWQQSDTPRVDVVPDKSEYQVGETAHLLVKSPYPQCEALITIEREGVADQRVLQLSGTAATVDVPITEAMVPNIFVGLVLQRARVAQGGAGSGSPGNEDGDDPGRPSLRLGYAELSVGKGIKRLSVAVATPHSEWKPRETVPIDLVVTDARKAGTQAEVQLYVVDDAVLRLTGYKLPDPVEAMFPRHQLATSIGEPLVRLVRKQKFGEKGEVQPGGGGGLEASGDVRNKFVTTVDWRTLTTDAQGRAHADIVLPDNLTTFRILAVAATAGDRFGSGETQIRVSLPLLVLPALPRFARVGDDFEAGVVVHSLRPLEVTVSAEVKGGLQLPQLGEAQRKVSVEAGVAKEVRFHLHAAAPGSATLRFRAEGGGLADAVEQTIPVQLPTEVEAVAVAGDTDASKQEGLLTPKDVRKDVGGLEVTLSSTALGGLDEGIQQLVDYPYGCLEQLSSRLIPFVALREVGKTFGAGPPALPSALPSALIDAQKADEVVRTTVAKIERLQTPGGGFLYWPNERCPEAWPSIYATLALWRAKEQGFAVDGEVLARAKRFLAGRAAGAAYCDRTAGARRETRVFALQVLARMGDPKPSYYDELYAEKDKLPLFAKAQLADAIATGKGKKQRAQALLQDLFDAAKETPREIHFEESDPSSYAPLLSSDTRTTGMVLQTLVDLAPGHPFVPKIARYLTGVRKGGRYRNTQEAAYALMALAEVVRVKEKTAPDFTARVLLGTRELAQQQFRGRSLEVKRRAVPMEQLLKAPPSLPLAFQVDGSGSLYYTALLRYAPEAMPLEPRNEGLFVQRWFEPYDQPGRAATEFAAGELVRVRVRVATSQERNFAAVEVPLPAGLEAVDITLGIARQAPTEAPETLEQEAEREEREREENGSRALDESWGGFYTPFNYNEKRDDRVVYFADHIPPGVHLVSFVARATTPGKFILKPAHGAEMYAPEVFGRSEGGTLSIVAAQPLAQK